MRIDIGYLRNFLEIILDHDKPEFDISHEKIKPLWETDEGISNLVFHMEVLADENLIEKIGRGEGVGFHRMSSDGYTVSVVPLRLTSRGHQFASDLSKPGILETIRSSFRDAGPHEVVKVAFALGKKAIEKRLDDLL